VTNFNFIENEIANCEKFQGHPTVRIMELRKNKLTNCMGMRNMPNLVELYLAENEIVTMEGI
jgi:hypothetical protein